MADRVKIGIIGVGQIGKSHVNTYQKIKDAEIVAIADVDEAEARRVADSIGVKTVFRNFRDLLKMKEIVAVDVCLHNNFHAPVSIAAMEAGKHVYCEKPLAGSYVDALSMLAARKRTGRKLMMQVATVFAKSTKAAKKLIDKGALGKIYYAKSSYYRRRGRPYVDGYGTFNFVRKEIAAGGALYDMGIYHIVQILHLLNNPEVLTVSGSTHSEVPMYEDRRKSGKWSVEELGLGFVRLAGGISFSIEEAWAINLGGTDGSKLAGSKGGVTLDPFTYHATLGDMEMNGEFDVDDADTRWHRCIKDWDAYDGCQQHWIAVLQGRVPLVDTAALGARMMMIAEGIFLSQKLGREVTPAEIRKHSISTALKKV